MDGRRAAVLTRTFAAAVVIAGCPSGVGSPDATGGRDGSMPALDATAADGGLAAPDGSIARDGAQPPDAAISGPRYDEVVFRATHNSYSGGTRGSIFHQLEIGVRFLELDVHDNDYATRGYSVGHDSPGHDVALGGDNPDDAALEAWLGVISDWSAAHPTHAPITIGLDLKDDLTDNARFADGNLAAMNALLERTFGERIVRPDEVAAGFPPVDALRGRVLAVLSGDEGTRIAYIRDPGNEPAVAVDSRGRVVEVHDSGSGTLWYWTGQRLPDRSIRFYRHGRYDTGRTPAVAMNDDGVIVEVHQSESATTLWYHVGQLGEDYEIAWGPSAMYDDGVAPTIRFDPGSATELREIHRSESSSQRWFWDATVDAGTRTLVFGAHDPTSDPLHLKDQDGGVRVFSSDVLQYATDAVTGRIRYDQVAFVEMQSGDDPDLADRFFAAPTGAHDLARTWRAAGGIVRLWSFTEPDTTLDPPVQLPATDTPEAAWYLEWTERVAAYER